MHKTTRLILAFVIGLWIVSVSSIAIFLTSVAPIRTQAAIETVTVAAQTKTPVRILGHKLTCTADSTFAECHVPLQTHPLEMTVTYTSGTKERQIAGCAAVYAGRTIPCTATYGGYIGGVRFLASVIIQSDLGLSSAQLQALRRENWIAQWDHATWLRVSTGLAVACGIFIAILGWQYPASPTKVLMGIIVGLSLFYLCLIQFYQTYPMASRSSNWNQQIIGFATLFSSVGMAATLALIWRHGRWMRVFTIIGGVGTFYLIKLLAYQFLVEYGFVMADY